MDPSFEETAEPQNLCKSSLSFMSSYGGVWIDPSCEETADLKN